MESAEQIPSKDDEKDQNKNEDTTMSPNNEYQVDSTTWEKRVLAVRQHYEQKGYRVHSGLQFGCELVLYADDPSRVHSDFCVHVVPMDGKFDWRMMQSLVRSMPDLHKTLIVANPIFNDEDGTLIQVQELAWTTEHAPFRHKKARPQVGSQRKKKRTTASG